MQPEDRGKNIFIGIISIAIAVVISQLFYLQIFQKTRYLEHSNKNRIRRVAVKPPRGIIYDRHGNVLVENRAAYTLSLIPFECRRNDHVVQYISKLVEQPVERINNLINRVENPFIAQKVQRDIDFSILVQIEERRLELPGAVYEVEPKRIYPSGIKGPHLFGYLGEISKHELSMRKEDGLHQGDLVGKKGLEKIYDKELRGHIGYNYVEMDALGREVRDITTKKEIAPKRGKDLYLTIDMQLQAIAESSFVDKRGGVVMLDVRDGGVLVLCSKPDFSPELFSSGMTNETWRKLVNDQAKPLFDRMLQSTYPPGSSFKMVLAAAALDSGRWDPCTPFICIGHVIHGKRSFSCWLSSGHGRVNLVDALKMSCNSFFYNLSLKIGIDLWSEYAKNLGFGVITGIDLPDEVDGLVPDRNYLNKAYGDNGWTTGMLLNLAIGQGDLLVTPLQMAQFAMFLANRGTCYQPHVLKRMFDPETGNSTEHVPVRKIAKDILPDVYDVIIEGMYRVVNSEGGTGRLSRVPNIAVAGKTGTAQNPHGEDHAWYIGFAPKDLPKVAICVLVENGGSGGARAAPIAGVIFRRYFQQDSLMADTPGDANYAIAVGQ